MDLQQYSPTKKRLLRQSVRYPSHPVRGHAGHAMEKRPSDPGK